MQCSGCGEGPVEGCPTRTEGPVREGVIEERTSELSFARQEGIREAEGQETSIAGKGHMQRDAEA